MIVDAGRIADGKGELKDTEISEELIAGKMDQEFELECQEKRQRSHPSKQREKEKDK